MKTEIVRFIKIELTAHFPLDGILVYIKLLVIILNLTLTHLNQNPIAHLSQNSTVCIRSSLLDNISLPGPVYVFHSFVKLESHPLLMGFRF